MKTLGPLLMLIACATAPLTSSAQSIARSSIPTGVGSIMAVQLGSDETRKFDITIKEVRPNAGAIAWGAFYDIAPATDSQPEKRAAGERNWTQCGKILVIGLEDSAIDGQRWKGWLQRVGVKSLQTANGKYETVPTYRVMGEPPAATAAVKPGDWQKRFGKTALDR